MGASQDTVLIVGAGIAGAAAAVALHKVRADVGASHASVFILSRPQRGWQYPSGVCKAGGRSGTGDRKADHLRTEGKGIMVQTNGWKVCSFIQQTMRW